MLQQKQMLEEATWTHPGLKAFLHDEGIDSTDADREIDADTVDLVRVFQDILTRLRERPVHTIDEESVTVAQMIDFVKRRLLMEDRPVSLRKMLQNSKSERALICTFLAMLELVRLQGHPASPVRTTRRHPHQKNRPLRANLRRPGRRPRRLELSGYRLMLCGPLSLPLSVAKSPFEKSLCGEPVVYLGKIYAPASGTDFCLT